MPGPILPISSGAITDIIRPVAGTRSSGGSGFSDVLSSAVEEVEAFGKNASSSVEKFIAGEGEELHTTILATQRAELSFDMFLQARNKVVSAYQEIMRMQM